MLGSRRGQLDTCTPIGSFQAWVFKAPLGTELKNCQLGCAYSGNISKTPPFQSSVDHLWICMVFLAEKSPNIRLNTLYIQGFGQTLLIVYLYLLPIH